MPVYECQCESCGKKFDVIATLAEKEAGLKPDCPKCGSKRVRQLFSRFTLLAGSKSGDDFDSEDDSGGGLDMGADDAGLDDYDGDELDSLDGSGDLDDI